ncbi:uncharacterized protein Pyn_40257 [Prunus yedoensis var. nudiflora]|uniref:Uncharacterized protein n=1 Tax=Prunus yedoensis var. nudiflora TaxID=2094558 RepID=A0A314YLN0_PRUYE|nr:uncharacterized protein Pyn_40257 [Prunus yedoensis var. nudiflora]
MKGQPRGGKARVGRRGRGAVRGRGARARGVQLEVGRGVVRGRGVVSEQQQTQARPKFNVKRGAHAPHVIRKTNLFAGLNLAKVQVPNLLHNLPKVHKLLHNLPKVYKLIKVQVHNLNQW